MVEQLVKEKTEELHDDDRLPYPNEPLTFSRVKPEDLPEDMGDWLDKLEAEAQNT